MEEDGKNNTGMPLETLDSEPGSVVSPTSSENSSQTTFSPDIPGPVKDGKPAKKGGFKGRLKELTNLYFLIFLLVLSLAIAATILELNWNKNPKSPKKTSSLTSQQLAQISGNTTIVGDSKQTLDIQGNTVMEGQLLVRKDVDVAGSIRVGGGLALSSVTVGGQGNFGQLQINGVLSVTGNTTFSGGVNVQKNLSVTGSGSFGGSLSAASLTVSSLQLTGDLKVDRHITLGGSLPGKSNGSALGGGGTSSVNGTDTAGTVTINTGSSPPAGCFVTINFSHKFNSTPHAVISPSNSNSAGLNYYTNRSTSGFSICTTNAPSGSRTYLFDYVVID